MVHISMGIFDLEMQNDLHAHATEWFTLILHCHLILCVVAIPFFNPTGGMG